LIVFFGLVVGSKSAVADGADVPEQVSAYFATGLVPRLADLYTSGAKDGATAPFDATAKVGTIRRLSAWTAAFSAGRSTDTPTELTNDWVAPVSDKSGTVLGLATVWINPGSDLPELADFVLGSSLVAAVDKAPAAMRLVHDSDHSAWFATDGKKLVPLVAGTSGLGAESTVADYQKLRGAIPAEPVGTSAATNPGLVFAGVTLGVVVLLLAVVILLPGRKRRDGPESVVDDSAVDDFAADAAPVATVPIATVPVATVPVATVPKTATVTAPKKRAPAVPKGTAPSKGTVPSKGTAPSKTTASPKAAAAPKKTAAPKATTATPPMPSPATPIGE
jgi:hypothetical protein